MLDKYLKINSIDPYYWGKSGWIFLNSIALTYKPEYKENYKQFILQLPNILPCEKCGNNLKKSINSIDEALESKENFLNWLIELRNNIYDEENRIKDKKNLKKTINEIYNREYNPNSIYIYIIILIVILVFLIYKYKKQNCS